MKAARTPPVEWECSGSVQPLAGSEFDEIRKLAYRSFGLDLKEGKRELVSARLRKVLRENNIRSYRDYCRFLAEDRTGQALAGMADALTTNHTAFLREPEHFRFLKQSVLPALARRSGLSLWCAACSTGEEAWTLACILADSLPGRSFRIVASDISNRVLALAREANYPADRVSGLPLAWHQRYFERGSGEWRDWYRISAEVRSRVEFHRLNLVDPYVWPEQFPVVFCRNVMIYFDQATQEKVVSRLNAFLEPGGYLFVGHSESLAGVRHGLEYVQPAVYRKPATKERR